MSVYDRENFAGRVNYAADCFSRQRAIGTRHFDTCFEMADGDAVVTALVRRARKNPKLRAGIAKGWHELRDGLPAGWCDTADKYQHIPTRALKDEARRQREQFYQRHQLNAN